MRSLKRFLHDQGLVIAMFGIFAITLVGLGFAGWASYNADQAAHGDARVSLLDYLASPAFGEAVFENWESEFLQMGSYVLLTALLVSRGSAESNDPDQRGVHDAAPRVGRGRHSGLAPVQRSGLAQFLYEHSLTIALFLFFAVSMALHAMTGAASFSRELQEHGGRGVGILEYVASSRFWFESLQNWQSEFLAVGALIVLSIFLRQRGSPESKPVAAGNRETGA